MKAQYKKDIFGYGQHVTNQLNSLVLLGARNIHLKQDPKESHKWVLYGEFDDTGNMRFQENHG